MTANAVAAPKPKAVLGVCTCRNPNGLLRLVTQLHSSIRIHVPARLIIVDNDDRGEGLALMQSLATQLPFPTTVVAEHVPGIPHARNRVIREALAEGFDYLLMLDDDEYPGEGWLDAMLRIAISSGADVVGGPVLPSFIEPPRFPLVESDFFRLGGRTRGSRTLVEITGNLLLSRAVVDGLNGDWFSTDFVGGGGEDTEFLRRTAAAGYVHALAPNAVVYETVPSERTDPRWQIRRSYAHGNVSVRVRLASRGFLVALAVETVNILGLGVTALIELLRGRMGTRARFRAAVKLARAAGKLFAFAGVRYQEYSPERYRPRR